MSQVSPPLRIALIAILAVGALWITVLRPKAEVAAPPTPATAPGVTGLATATGKAKGAVATADAAGARNSDQAAATATAPSTPAGAATAQAAATAKAAAAPAQVTGLGAKDPSAPYVRALARGKVVVLLFANRRSADDRAARKALAGVGTRRGKVVKRVLDVRGVGRYEAITRGVKVDQSPTTLVIGSDRAARTVVGLTTTAEVQQLVDDTLAAPKKAE